eukprot:1208248-Rhodomonas_salina.1
MRTFARSLIKPLASASVAVRAAALPPRAAALTARSFRSTAAASLKLEPEANVQQQMQPRQKE